MTSIIEYLFGAASFMPHGYCLLWRPDLVAMHATSDFLIAASYFSIPIALASFVIQRKDIEYPWVFWHFATFIAACGATHAVGLLTLWWPIYGAQGLVKAVTAGLSVTTAFMLWPLIPKALALPSPEQLRQSNERLQGALAEKEQALVELQSLLDAAPLAMVLVDGNGRITRVSSGAARIFGYEVEELVGRSVETLLPDWLREVHARGEAWSVPRPTARKFEISGRSKDDRELPIEVNVGQYDLADGPRICASVRDISRERAVEAARRQSDAVKSSVLAAALDAVITIDHRGKIVDWNRAAEHVFGYSNSEAIGHDMAELIVPPRLREAHRRGMEQFLLSGEGPVLGRLIELPALRANGVEFPVDLYILPIPAEGPPLFTAFARDISDRKRSEQELIEEKARLANLVESAALSILTIDSGGLIESINPATEKLFGYSEKELIGQNVRMLMPEPYRRQHESYLENYLRTGTKKIIGIGREVTGLRKDGTAFPIHLAVSEFEAKGERYFTGIIHDLSDRKRAEEALRESEWRLAQAQKLEAVGQLSGGVAHDFNNLLTVIGGNLELHSTRLPPNIDQRLLNDAREAVEMGARLTERLLTFSRQRRLAPEIVNLNEQVLDMAELLRRALGEAVDLSAVLASDLWSIRADPSGLENVILNLAINARDAMPRGGKLIIETRNITLDQGKDEKLDAGDYVLLSVSDSGSGMPPDVLGHAFEPFFTTKEPGKGTGLGLSSVYGFVKQSGGHAEIYSELGTGTTVNVYLPRNADGAQQRYQPEPLPLLSVAEGQTILVVEDNPLVRRLTVRRVEELGFRVIEADSGSAAAKILASAEPIHLVFTDVVMTGGMSGLELARLVRDIRPGLRVVLTTGFAEEIARGDDTGDRRLRILRKPYSQAQLIRAFQEALSA